MVLQLCERIDCVLGDDRLVAFEECVRASVSHATVGVQPCEYERVCSFAVVGFLQLLLQPRVVEATVGRLGNLDVLLSWSEGADHFCAFCPSHGVFSPALNLKV